MNVFYVILICFHHSVLLLSIDPTDEVLNYPYKSSGRYRREDVDSDACPHYSYGERPHVIVTAHEGPFDDKENTDGDSGIDTADNNQNVAAANIGFPIVETHHTTVTLGDGYWNNRDVLVHVSYVNNPVDTVSVYEPLRKGSCREGEETPATVQQSAAEWGCRLAINAGFFNTTSGECFGNIVSDGRLVKDSQGIQNAHFGITKAGSLFFGYLSEIDIVAEDFAQLVGGVIWVLRDGQDNVDASIKAECQDTETTGTLQRFAAVISARTLVASDKHGRLMLVQIDGKTDKYGASLYEAATILQKFGAVQAVNLDGGGSSTLVINHTLVNYPSDWCGETYQCSRNVTTILCVHDPYCDPRDCGGHGSCDLGTCRCHGNWKGDKCDRLECPESCSGHGTCTEYGCVCMPGYHGDDCSSPCSEGWYGTMCTQRCRCDNNATCDIEDGSCICNSGFTGDFCQYRCRYGYYGDNCSVPCNCDDDCLCDHVTGSCNYTVSDTDFMQVGSCITRKLQRQESLEEDMSEEYQSAIVTVIVLSVVTSLSLLMNCVLLWQSAIVTVIVLSVVTSLSLLMNCVLLWQWGTKWRHKARKPRYKRAQACTNGQTFLFQPANFSSFTTSTTSDEETSFIKKFRKPKS